MKYQNKKNILLLGGGYEQLPAILEAKKFGYNVICVDKNTNCEGKKYSDKFYNISIKDKKKLNQIVEKEKIHGVASICSEIAVPIVSYLASKFNFVSLSKNHSKILTNKYLMKKFFIKNNIKSPTSKLFKNKNTLKKFVDQVGFPIIIKPVDSFGQRGIFKIHNLKNLEKKLLETKRNSINRKILLEKFVDGPEINVVAIIYNKKTSILSFSDRIVYKKKGFGIAFEHSYPSKIKKEIILEIKKIIYEIVQYLNLDNLVLYPQFIIDKNNQPNLIEIAGRVPGGFMREVSMLASGIDPVKFQILIAMKEKKVLNKSKIILKKKSVFVKFLTSNEINKLSKLDKKNIYKAQKILGIYKIYLNQLKKIPNLKNSSSRFGAIISHGKNLNYAKTKAIKALNLIIKK